MKEEWETFIGEGFSFNIAKIYGKNIKSDKTGQWEYGEFILITPLNDKRKSPMMESFFYFWTKNRVDFELKALRKQCLKIATKFLFEPGFRLRMKESRETAFSGFPAILIKFQFKFISPEASGPLNFFITDNTAQQKTYFLGVLAEQGGDYSREKQVIQFLEDKVIMSFKFAK